MATNGDSIHTKTDSIDWSYFISNHGKQWKPSAIRGLFPLEQTPGMISFLAGKPNPSTFPFSSIDVNVKPIVPTDPEEKLTITGKDLDEALQYGPTAGLKGLVSFLEDLQEARHGRAKDGSWRLTVGSGSQDLINKAFQSVVNDGDSILIETPVYSGTLGLLTPLGANLIEIPTDTAGISVDALQETLSNWSTKYPEKRFPKLLYTVPTGSNPTGCSSPLDRKQKILSLAREYNLLILEDDAYAYLSFDPDNQVKSYFALETENSAAPGRVVRFDSFSKVISSGMRLGFMTGAKEIVDIVDLHTANTNLQPNSMAQAIVLVLLTKWGLDGFFAHTRRVAAFYKEKRDMFEKAAHKHLDGLASWVTPDAGMFLYIKLNLTTDGSQGDSSDLVSNTAFKKGVLAVPGNGFSPDPKNLSEYVRVSFSMASEQDAETGFARLAECIKEARGEQ